MKLSSTHRFISALLALLMFTTSVGFSADLHFCKGQLKSVSLIGEASSCHTAKKSCPNHQNLQEDNKEEQNCCSNETIEVEDLDVDFTITADPVFLIQQAQIVPIFIYSLYLPAPSLDEYSPIIEQKVLLPSVDIYVQLGRFLL